MEVPKEYIFEQIKLAINERINGLETRLIEQKIDLKDDIKDLKKIITNYQTSCITNMKTDDDRIKELEKFKYKVYAYSGAIAFTSGILVKIILN